ncbi:MAG: DUF89 family protein [Anaerolinea sp.]|nr:DUF89 family protein [Anaerolinea sp.]
MPPPPIRTDGSNWFAANTMRVRVPAIIREAQTLTAVPSWLYDGLERLRESILNDEPIPMLPESSPDYDLWLEAFATHEGETWLNAEWFYAEVYTYRLIVEAVKWHRSGIDPFLPKKHREIAGDNIKQAIQQAVSVPPDNRLSDLLLAALWGNRVDLSYAVGTTHGAATDDDLLADDRAAVIEYLKGRSPGHIHLILDNAGTELALDLLLTDALFDMAERITLHVKDHPTFVSDATRADVLAFLNEMAGRGSITKGYGAAAREAADRLQAAILEDRLRIEPDRYWNSPYFLWQMPGRLTWQFDEAALVIVKGDANYRRMTGDALWEPATPFADVVSYFPAPLVGLRTGKSDTIVGLRPGVAERLDAEQPDWRVNGKHGVIQFKP